MNYLEQRDVVDEMLYMAKEQHYSTVIQDNTHDSKLLFRTVDKLLQGIQTKDIRLRTVT